MAAPSPISSRPPVSYSNHIDLTLDDDDDDDETSQMASPRHAKRARTEISRQDLAPSPFLDPSSFIAPFPNKTPSFTPQTGTPYASQSPFVQHPNYMPVPNLSTYRPLFAGPAPYPTPQPHLTPNPPARSPSRQLSSSQQSRPSSSQSSFYPLSSQMSSSQPTSSQFSTSSSQHPSSQFSSSSFAPPDRQIIDLTDSPSPPPFVPSHQPAPQPFLPPELPPKTPVCIGQLTVTALILYPIPYILPHNPGETEWAYVRLQYEHNANKPHSKETIHIKSPSGRGPNGENISGEIFGVVEQKVADYLGPMLGKGLIRLDANIRKGPGNLPILPLQMLVYTPKGNIPVVGNYLEQNNLILDDPRPPSEMQRLTGYHYYNPHEHLKERRRAMLLSNSMSIIPKRDHSRWTTPAAAGKSVEVQRSQVDELFKTLKDGAGLAETEPGPEIATKLYPHQKKALTFLLERERENPSHSSLWEERYSPLRGLPAWFHIVTQKEVFEPPKEAKGSILADDMGLGKTISTVSLIAATLRSAEVFASSPLDVVPKPPLRIDAPDPSHFAGSVWGMPENGSSSSGKGKAKMDKLQDKLEADYSRSCRIKAKSRATLIVCPLSTVSNWEDQFREHWKGEVSVIGGSGSVCLPQSAPSSSQSSICQTTSSSQTSAPVDEKLETKRPGRVREGRPLRVYIYHGNARRPDPSFLSDFDCVITTYATLASEFSKQSRSLLVEDDEDDDGSSDGQGGVDIDEHGNQVLRLPKPRKAGTKRKKSATLQANNPTEIPSALQSIHWFRVVLDEAHSIKETSTVASRACCDLMADRRLCLTGTPVQNKLDDVFALIKFLRLDPLDDKNVWTEYIGSPVKFGQKIGVARLQTVMQCITLRRTKDTKALDGKRILTLPPRRDELRYLKLDDQEKEIYTKFLEESKAEFNELSRKNEVMKNYVGILQKILRLRQICDHFELVQGKIPGQDPDNSDAPLTYEDIITAIARDGFNAQRAAAIFAILRESATTQCVECGCELCSSSEANQGDGMDGDSIPTPTPAKRGRRKGTASRGSTRANSPNTPRPVLTKCQHLFCIECYRNSICPGWPNVGPDIRRSCSVCQAGLAPQDAQEVKTDQAADASQKKKVQKREKRQKGVPENFRPSTKIKALLNDLVQFSRMNPHSSNYDPEPEIQLLDENGVPPLDDSQIVKTIVFSQWTTMLDKIEDALEAAGIRYDRLDGTMKREDRTRAMDALKHDPACEVLLVSLKAGGVGLNLTAAQRVYLMDPYWNPAVENQAVDRIHRLGQTRPVTTIKFIIEDSIEAKLLEVQRKKTELANMTLGQNFSKRDLLQRRLDEITHLLGP
ncbi:SNF2 family N-terminal domain-containing protein [Gymnopilus junonius]|uniref:SNF2 family N-terminal domain-containing protein n=1 Tax=Gymnopilus junonius TaxID=109634 RepID=A0A9P5P2C2_GYMJU|nr:SNF2 family N-terminal domain-containing protein [Gymnopilus junonius]